MNGLLKGALAAGGGAVGVEMLRRAIVLGGATEVRAVGEVALQGLPEQGSHRRRRVRRLQGGPDPLQAHQGPRRRRGHAHLAGELLHLLAHAGQRYRRRRGDPERRPAFAPDPDPARRQLPAGGAGEHRPREAVRHGRRQGVPLRASRALAGGRARVLRHTRRGGVLHKHKGHRAGEEIRDRVIERYEETTLAGGEIPDSKLTFIVIGGGATGVEVASELHSLVQDLLVPDYPNIDPHRVKIILVDAQQGDPQGARPRPEEGRAQKAGRPPDRGDQQRQGEEGHGRPGDPRRRTRDHGRERHLDGGRQRERKARRARPSSRRAQGPYGGPLYAGRGPRQRLGDRRLRGERGRRRRARAPQRPGRRAGGRGRSQEHPRRYRRRGARSPSATSRSGSSSS